MICLSIGGGIWAFHTIVQFQMCKHWFYMLLADLPSSAREIKRYKIISSGSRMYNCPKSIAMVMVTYIKLLKDTNSKTFW